MFLASSSFSFEDFYSLANSFFDTVLNLEDFFFKYRSFNIRFSPSADSIFTLFGIDHIGFDGSIVHLLLGVGLPTLLGFRLVKFVLDIIL